MSEPVNPHNPPTNSFGGNPPLPQHQPGTQQKFYGQQTAPAPAPAPKKSRAGIIAGAAIAGLLVLGGGAYAVTSVLNVAGDKDIAKAVPSNSAVFLQVDLNPSNSQKTAALSVASKIDALVDDKDKYDTEGKDFKEIATDPAFEELDYKTEVEPWIGDKVAVAAWGDFAQGGKDFSSDFRNNYDPGYEADPYDDYYDDEYLDGAYDDLDNTGKDGGVKVTTPDLDRVSHTEEGAERPKKDVKDPSVVLVYEVKNKDKAEEAAKKIIDKDKGVGAYTLHGSYLVLAENDEVISDYVDSIEKGDLSVNETYTSDMKVLGGDNIATSWLDLSKMGVDGYLENIGYSEDGEELRGRVATGVSLVNEGITSKTKVIGIEGYDNLTKNTAGNAKGVTDIGNFSKDSVAAVTIAGLPEIAAAALDEYEKQSPNDADNFRQSAREAGFNFPDDFKKIFGSETGIGYAPATSDNSPSIEYRAKGSDEGTIKDILKEAGSNSDLDVTADGDTTIVKYAGKNLSSEKLSSHEKFNDALKDLDKSNAAVFVDVDALVAADDSKSNKEDKDYGVIGATSSHNEEDNVSDFTVRWIF